MPITSIHWGGLCFCTLSFHKIYPLNFFFYIKVEIIYSNSLHPYCCGSKYIALFGGLSVPLDCQINNLFRLSAYLLAKGFQSTPLPTKERCGSKTLGLGRWHHNTVIHIPIVLLFEKKALPVVFNILEH